MLADWGSTMIPALLLQLLTVSPSTEVNEVYGLGKDSCGAWTSSRSARRMLSRDSVDISIYESWVLGYLTGFIARGPGRPREVDVIFAAMDDYCVLNPS